MKQQSTTIVRLWLGKLPAFHRIGIANQFCSAASPLETNSQGADPEHGPEIAFHNQAPVAVAVPGLRGSPGLCSSRAVEVLWQMFPATSPFLSATSSPADRSNSFGNTSPMPRLTRRRGKDVFTRTHLQFRKRHNFGLAFMGVKFKKSQDQRVKTIRRLWLPKRPSRGNLSGFLNFLCRARLAGYAHPQFLNSNTSKK